MKTTNKMLQRDDGAVFTFKLTPEQVKLWNHLSDNDFFDEYTELDTGHSDFDGTRDY